MRPHNGKGLSKRNSILDMALTFFGWLAVFAAGVTIPSEPYREVVVRTCYTLGESQSLQAPSSEPTVRAAGSEEATATPPAKPAGNYRPLKGWELVLLPLLIVTIFVAYTPTNLVLLCTFGAMLGAFAFRIASELRLKESNGRRTPASRPDEGFPPTVTAMVHGLCVFLGIIGGLIVIQGSLKFDSSAPDLYFRVAAVATLFSIAAGTNKHFIRDVTKAFKPFQSAQNPA
jgi:hypothetical protein